MKIIKQLFSSSNKNFCYIFGDEKEITLIDPAYGKDNIEKELDKLNSKLKYIINTHSHYDHIELNDYFQKKFNVPIIIHNLESANISGEKIIVEGGENFNLGDNNFEIIYTPGHTPGSITIKFNKYLFTGDTLFSDEDCGRIFYKNGIVDMFDSLKKFKTMDENLIVYSGHKYGKYNYTTLDYEFKNNPAILCNTLEKLKEFKNV